MLFVPSSARELFLVLSSGITHGGAGEPYGVFILTQVYAISLAMKRQRLCKKISLCGFFN